MSALSPCSGDEDGKSTEDECHVGIDGIESWVTADGTVKRKLSKIVPEMGKESEEVLTLSRKKDTLHLETDDQSCTGSTAEASHDSSSPTLMIGIVGSDVLEQVSSLNPVKSGKMCR